MRRMSTTERSEVIRDVVCQLHEISGIKFGQFKLKGGIMSPVYFDLRVIISRPKLLQQVSRLLWDCKNTATGQPGVVNFIMYM